MQVPISELVIALFEVVQHTFDIFKQKTKGPKIFLTQRGH